MERRAEPSANTPKRKAPAMTPFLALCIAIFSIGITRTVILVSNDGLRRIPTRAL